MNDDILNKISSRSATIDKELYDTQARLTKLNILNTIVFLGSARIPSLRIAQHNLDLAIKENNPTTIEKAKNILDISTYYEQATQLANMISLWAKNNNHPYYICTGGGPGIMEAANKGAFLADHPSLGFTITLPFENGANHFIKEEYVFNFKYFFTRKFWFAYLAQAIVVFPGGFGTFDELFEILTLLQTKKIKKTFPLVLIGTQFFRQTFNLDIMSKYNLINKEDCELILITDDLKAAFDYITNNIHPYSFNEHL